jgi:hypothetical protein
MQEPRTYWTAGILAALLTGCGDHPTAPPPAPSEPSWKLLATGEIFVDVWGCSPNAVFALGEASLFYYNGSSWTVLPDPPAGGTAIWGTSPENLFVIAGGDIYHYDGHVSNLVVHGPTPLYRFMDIWGSSDRDIFAVGGGGTILHYDGSVWVPMTSGTGSDLRCLWGISGRDVYAAGAGGTVVHYDGSTWTSLSTPSLEPSCIWASSSSDIYCVGQDDNGDGIVFHYDGSSWRPLYNAYRSLSGVWGSSATDVYVVGERGTMLHSDGSTWSEMGTLRDIKAIWGSSSQDVFVVGGGYDWWSEDTGSLLLHYNGTEWRDQATNLVYWGIELRGVGGSSATDVYFIGADGSDGHPALVHFDGSSFDAGAKGWKYSYLDVWVASPDAVFVVGDRGFEVDLLDGSLLAETGSFVNTSKWSLEEHPISVWAMSKVNAFVTTGGGGVYHYNGSTWNPMTTGTTSSLGDIWGSSDTDVFAVGDAGTVIHYDGSSWARMPTETSNTLWGVWGSSGTDVYAVGDAGTILHYDGAQWKSVPSMTHKRLTGVWGSSDRDVYVVGGGILHYDGQAWTTMGTTHVAEKVWGSGPGDVYVTEYKRILHYGIE